MQPFIKLNSYFGGKSWGNVPYILISQIPKHERFISGFLGHCALLRYIQPARFRAAIELNDDIILEWSTAVSSDARSHRINIREFREAAVSQFPALAPGVIEVFRGDSLGVNFPSDPNTFIYLDPPYPHDSRKSQKRYKYELSDEQHRLLLAKFSDTSSKVMFSSYPNEIYDTGLKGWRILDFQSMTRSGKMATERLYMNYPEPWPTSLHDTRFTGKDFRDRERRKRIVRTITKKIAMLEPFDKAFFFQEMKRNGLEIWEPCGIDPSEKKPSHGFGETEST